MQRSAGYGWGEEAAGDGRPWLRGRHMGAENCADGCGWRECNGVAGNGWEKKPLQMGDLGCADGTWVRRTARTVLDGASATAWLEMGGGKEAAGNERAWLRGRLWTVKIGAENCADGCGRRGCKGAAGNG